MKLKGKGRRAYSTSRSEGLVDIEKANGALHKAGFKGRDSGACFRHSWLFALSTSSLNRNHFAMNGFEET